MTNTVSKLELIERFVNHAEQALQQETDKVCKWRIQQIITETTKRLETLKGDSK